MTSFLLKIIAIVSMFIDHLGDAIFQKVTYFNLIGRIAFPIFAFQISEGYKHTKNLKKYYLRLLLFAIISQAPFMLFRTLFTSGLFLNIFFTLLAGLTAIFAYDKIVNCSNFNFCKSTKYNKLIKQFLGIFIAICLAFIAETCKFDYGFFGVTIIFLFYIFQDNKIAMIISFSIACILKYLFNILTYGYHYYYIFLCLFTILPILFIALYNKKQGKKVKYLLYFFYPVHLLILYLIFK